MTNMADSFTDASTASDSGRGQSEPDDLAYYNQSMSTFLPKSTQCSSASRATPGGAMTLPSVASTSLTVGNGSLKHSAHCDTTCSFRYDDRERNCCVSSSRQQPYGNNLSFIDDVRKPIGVKTYSFPQGVAATMTSHQHRPSFDDISPVSGGGGKQSNVITPSTRSSGTVSTADRCPTPGTVSPSLGGQHRSPDKMTNLNQARSWSATPSVGVSHHLATARVVPLVATACSGCRLSDTVSTSKTTKQLSLPRRRLPPLPPVFVTNTCQASTITVSRPSHLDSEEKVDPEVVMPTTSNTDSIATVGSDDGASSTSGSFIMHLQSAHQRQQQEQQFGRVLNRLGPDRRLCISDL